MKAYSGPQGQGKAGAGTVLVLYDAWAVPGVITGMCCLLKFTVHYPNLLTFLGQPGRCEYVKKRGNTGNLSATRAHADAIRAQDRLIRRRESQTVTCEVWDGLLLFASNPGNFDLALQVVIFDSEGAAR